MANLVEGGASNQMGSLHHGIRPHYLPIPHRFSPTSANLSTVCEDESGVRLAGLRGPLLGVCSFANSMRQRKSRAHISVFAGASIKAAV